MFDNRNEKGKLMLEKCYFNYSKLISEEIEKHPDIFLEVLREMNIDSALFYSYLENNPFANIVVYDKALCLMLEKNKKDK